MKVRYGKYAHWWLKPNAYNAYIWEWDLEFCDACSFHSPISGQLSRDGGKYCFLSLALYNYLSHSRELVRGQSMFHDSVSTRLGNGMGTLDVLLVDFPPGIPNLYLGGFVKLIKSQIVRRNVSFYHPIISFRHIAKLGINWFTGISMDRSFGDNIIVVNGFHTLFGNLTL